jgi:hypothetical protein
MRVEVLPWVFIVNESYESSYQLLLPLIFAFTLLPASTLTLPLSIYLSHRHAISDDLLLGESWPFCPLVMGASNAMYDIAEAEDGKRFEPACEICLGTTL